MYQNTSWLNCTEMFFLTIFVQLILIHLLRLILQLGPLGSRTQSAILSPPSPTCAGWNLTAPCSSSRTSGTVY